MLIKVTAPQWLLDRHKVHKGRSGHIYRVTGVNTHGDDKYAWQTYSITGASGKPLQWGDKIPTYLCTEISPLESWAEFMQNRRHIPWNTWRMIVDGE